MSAAIGARAARRERAQTTKTKAPSKPLGRVAWAESTAAVSRNSDGAVVSFEEADSRLDTSRSREVDATRILDTRERAMRAKK